MPPDISCPFILLPIRVLWTSCLVYITWQNMHFSPKPCPESCCWVCYSGKIFCHHIGNISHSYYWPYGHLLDCSVLRSLLRARRLTVFLNVHFVYMYRFDLIYMLLNSDGVFENQAAGLWGSLHIYIYYQYVLRYSSLHPPLPWRDAPEVYEFIRLCCAMLHWEMIRNLLIICRGCHGNQRSRLWIAWILACLRVLALYKL